MATYPIKMLKDEEGKPFVPLISLDSVQDMTGQSINEILDKKLETTNLIAGTQIELEVEGNNITISNSAEGTKLIDNLETEQAGTGALDAHQGKVLLEKIPIIANNLNTPESGQVLSAYQGYVLAGRVAPTGGAEGQVLKKASTNDYDFEWGDAADPNAIVGDGSIMKIIELTYEEYLELEANGQLQDDTEYHISDWNENERTYLTDEDIQKKIDTTIKPLEDQIDLNVEAIEKMKTKILWTNPNPTEAFTSQTITVLDDSQYEYIMLVFDAYVPYDNYGTYIFKKPNATYQLPYGQLLWNYSSNQLEYRERYITRNSSTAYNFSTGKLNGTVTEELAVPIQIIGFNL